MGRDARGVVLSGEPGVGKSRLAADVLAEAVDHGADTEMVFATRSTATVPFGVLVHLARPRRSLPSRTELLIDLVDAIAARSARATVVMLVDDAHLLDEGAAAVMHALAARGTCRLLLTVRAGADVPDAITALWKDEQLLRVDLRPLLPAALSEFMEAFLSGPVNSATRHRLAQWSAGSPLLLRELLLSGLESGVLTQGRGRLAVGRPGGDQRPAGSRCRLPARQPHHPAAQAPRGGSRRRADSGRRASSLGR